MDVLISDIIDVVMSPMGSEFVIVPVMFAAVLGVVMLLFRIMRGRF